VIVRSLVTFHSDIADNGIETEDGDDFVEWPGRVHALIVVEMLQALGWGISEMRDSNEHGWDVEATLGRKTVWAHVTPLDEIILDIEEGTPFWTWLFSRKPSGPAFTETLMALDAALRADGRFHDFRWFTDKEYQRRAPGAQTPVSDIKEMAGYIPSPPSPPDP
jgi:hypothetical protein